MQIPVHLQVSQEVKRLHSKYGSAWNNATIRDARGTARQCSKQLLRKGYIYEYQEKNYDEALNFYNQAILHDPNNEEALYRKGALLLEHKNDYKNSKECFVTILNSINEYNVDAWGKLGDIHLRNRNYEKALNSYTFAINRSSQDVLQEHSHIFLLFNAAKLNCILFNRFPLALKQFKRVFKITNAPIHVISAHKHIGFCKLAMHDFEGALEAFKKARRIALRTKPDEEGWFQLWKCFCYVCLGDYDRAWKCHHSSFHLNQEPQDGHQLHLLQVFGLMALQKDIEHYQHFFPEYDEWREVVNDVMKETIYLPKYAIEVLFEDDEASLNGTEDLWYMKSGARNSSQWRSFYGGDFMTLEVFKNGNVLKWSGFRHATKLLNKTFNLPDWCTITRVYAVQNDDLKENFYEVSDELTENYPYWRNYDQGHAATKQIMDDYIHQHGFRASTEVSYIPVLHGLRNPSNEVIWKASGICREGFQRVNPQDPGHFGQGLSFTTCADYALNVYCQQNDFGEKVLIIGQAAVGRAFACDPSGLRGQGCQPGYDAHYGRFRPRSNPSVEWDEWVFFDSRQVLPQFVVFVRDRRRRRGRRT